MRIVGYSAVNNEEIYDLFYKTVHSVCSPFYTEEELDAWAPREADAAAWCEALLHTYTVLALSEDDAILGFGNFDMEKSCLDRLYVASSFQGKGVGSAILSSLEQKASGDIYVYSSDAALSFFISHGYSFVRDNYAVRNGLKIHNSLLMKSF